MTGPSKLLRYTEDEPCFIITHNVIVDPDPSGSDFLLYPLLLISVVRICDHWSTDPPRLNFEPPRLHCERPRPSTAAFVKLPLKPLKFECE
jgi:hypothetical protein